MAGGSDLVAVEVLAGAARSRLLPAALLLAGFASDDALVALLLAGEDFARAVPAFAVLVAAPLPAGVTLAATFADFALVPSDLATGGFEDAGFDAAAFLAGAAAAVPDFAAAVFAAVFAPVVATAAFVTGAFAVAAFALGFGLADLAAAVFPDVVFAAAERDRADVVSVSVAASGLLLTLAAAFAAARVGVVLLVCLPASELRVRVAMTGLS